MFFNYSLNRILIKLINKNKFINQQREFKSKNVLHHRKANKIPFYVGVERVGLIFAPILFIITYYDAQHPDSFLKKTMTFEELENVVDEDGSKGIKKKRKKYEYPYQPSEIDHR